MTDEQTPEEIESSHSTPLWDAPTGSADARPVDDDDHPTLFTPGERPGDVVGPYHLLRVLGTGGFGATTWVGDTSTQGELSAGLSFVL